MSSSNPIYPLKQYPMIEDVFHLFYYSPFDSTGLQSSIFPTFIEYRLKTGQDCIQVRNATVGIYPWGCDATFCIERPTVLKSFSETTGLEAKWTGVFSS